MVNGHDIPPPPPDPAPSFEPPRFNSVYNMITRRLRAANTLFGDRVKLFLRQIEDEQWSKLKRPYLLVVPRQVSRPREIDIDYMSFVNPREVMFIAQFDDRMSEASYLAANDIDTAEAQLIKVLCNWMPLVNYKPTLYNGMRIQSTKAPDVKVAYTFIFYETVVLPDEAPIFDESELPWPAVLDGIGIHVSDPACNTCVCEPEYPPGPNISVSGGGCPPERLPDPCEPQCPPILGDEEHAASQAARR
jgi:hypothetical protein